MSAPLVSRGPCEVCGELTPVKIAPGSWLEIPLYACQKHVPQVQVLDALRVRTPREGAEAFDGAMKDFIANSSEALARAMFGGKKWL